MLAHLESLHAFYGEDVGVRVARKHIGWYCRQLPTRPRPPAALMQATSATAQRALADEFLAQAIAPVRRAA